MPTGFSKVEEKNVARCIWVGPRSNADCDWVISDLGLEVLSGITGPF